MAILSCIFAVLVTVLAGMTAATTITVANNCGSSIDPAFYPAADGGVGGFELANGASSDQTVPSGWSGRVWARTGCDSDGNCATGGCTGGVNCTGPSTTGPTLAAFTINGFASSDYITPNVGDGFNVAVTVTPGNGCRTAPASCTDASGDGNGCGDTVSCPTGTAYTVSFC